MGRLGGQLALITNRLFPALSDLRGDVAGGFTAAIITFPQAIGYGLLAFAPLGASFAGDAAALGIYSAVLAGFLASLLGSMAIQITGPKVPLTLLVAVLVTQLALDPRLAVNEEIRITLILGAVSISVMIGGLFQIVLGVSGIGAIAKYVPYPVIGGFMNGIALLLILKQIPLLLGVPGDFSLHGLIAQPELIRLSTLLVGSVTLAAIFLAKRYVKRVPAYVVGLIAGTGTHYLLAIFADVRDPGPLVGTIGFQWPAPVNPADVVTAAVQVGVLELLPALVFTGLVIGLIGALESLFSCVVSDNLTNERHDSNRELIGQGVGNLACALVGALPAAGSVPRSQANFKAGGRTRLSGILGAGFVFLFFLVLGPLVGTVPMAAVAAMLMFVGFDLFDGWTVSLARKLRAQVRQRREVLLDLVVALAVAIITVSVNLIVAVGVGIVAASALFIARMGNTIVRRRYDGCAVRSRKMRSPIQEQYLAGAGNQILVLELQGPIFFGSGDKLIAELEGVSATMRYLILDMRRVTDIDSTGTRVLPQLKSLIEKEGTHFLISNLAEAQPIWQFLDFMGVVGALGRECFFPTTDEALEWAEEGLLAQADVPMGMDTEMALEDSPLTDGMTALEMEYLMQRMTASLYTAGDLIFREGDSDSGMLLVLRGSVTIGQEAGSNGKVKRVFTYGPGSVIGELAMLDQQKRSASAWADGVVAVLGLSADEFKVIKEHRPQLAVKLLSNLARVVSNKLRRASNELAALEDG